MEINYPIGYLIEAEESCYIDEKQIVIPTLNILNGDIEKRGGGNFKHKGIFLNSKYDWRIVRDNENMLVLLQLTK